MKVRPFKEVISGYKVVFFDAYGVLKNSSGMVPGIKKTFEYLHKKEIDFCVLTNDSSRSPIELAAVYNRAGIDEVTESKIVSSGMLAREYLRYKVKHGLVAYLGTKAAAHYIETLGLEAVAVQDLDLARSEEVKALLMLDDEGFDWVADVNKSVNLLRKFNIPVIVANTDRAYPTSRTEVAVAIGSVSNMIEKIVHKKFIRFGKPDTQMFTFAFDRIKKERVLTKDDILMVGDTLETDIMGGNHFGIDTALVLTGNTQSHNVDVAIESSGIIPDYICDAAII
ncbi:MAG: HAD-IIA family hydrolase [Rhodothermales bacterium]